MIRPVAVAVLVVLIAGCSGGPNASPSAGSPSAGSPSAAPSVASPTQSPDTTAWIVYQSGDGLRLTDPSGGVDRGALPFGPGDALHADWSPDGSRLAFVVNDSDGTRDVWTSDWDGSNARRLVDCMAPCRDADSPAWSPDGLRIAFTRIDNVDGHNPGSQLQAVTVATGEIATLAITQGAEYAGGARWSPDGRSLVVDVTRYIDDGNDTSTVTGSAIAVVNLDDAAPAFRLITTFESFSSYPDWHPTDPLIVFASGTASPLDPAGDPYDLFTVKPDGTGLTRLTHLGPDDDSLWMPAFQRDGGGILVTVIHRPDGHLTLGWLRVDGTGLIELGDGRPISGAHSRQRYLSPIS
jgi:Tol biopolymer transport system component